MLNIQVVWKHNRISHVDLIPHGRFFSENSQIQEWLDSYLRKEPKAFPLPLDLDHLTPFTQIVLEAVSKIPFGSTKSYGEVAKEIGHPRAARAVGTACGNNPYPLFIPCHRVVASNGIGGFSLDPEIKVKLLLFEQS